MTEITLPTGAVLRLRQSGTTAVLFLGGGSSQELPGTWSASTAYLARHVASTHSDLLVAELKYRIRSWKQLEMCLADGRAALAQLASMGVRDVLLVGYSLGGAIATQVADDPLVHTVIGLAPWLPQALSPLPMRARTFHVLHGTLDPLAGTPGVSATSSREGFDRIVAAGATGSYQLIRGGLHAIALRTPWGGLLALPGARRWKRQLAALVRSATSREA